MINGELVDASTASLKVNDLSLLRGYGAFDYFLVREGIPVFAEDHIERFFASANFLRLEIPFDPNTMSKQVRQVIAANGLPEAGIRLLLTGGYVLDSYTPIAPNILILQHPYVPYPAEKYRSGIKMMTYEYVRDMPEIKTTHYTMGIWLLDKLKAANASDVLYHKNGKVSESARSNFFIVDADDKLITPNDNVLKGITRKHLLSLVQNHYQVEIRPLRSDELPQAKEAFICSTIKEILPVTQIDDFKIGDGRPGPITLALLDQFRQYKKSYIASFKATALG